MAAARKNRPNRQHLRQKQTPLGEADNLMNAIAKHRQGHDGAAPTEVMRDMIVFVREFMAETEQTIDLVETDPHLNMALHLVEGHLEAKMVTPSSLIASSGAPYATANRRMKAMIDDGLIEQRPRSKSGKSYSLHPSDKLLMQWMQLAGRIRRLAEERFSGAGAASRTDDYYFGESYAAARSIPPLQVLRQPLHISGGLKVLGHGDPTFMVMENLKRQFENVLGVQIHQRAFSIDRLRNEALRNAQRAVSRYDLIAVDLPWIGEFAEKNVLLPLDDALDVAALDPADFHTAGWKAMHWGNRPFAVPTQMTPELLFYRKDLFAEAGLAEPTSVDLLLNAARVLHRPNNRRYGIAWNAARGTALGHTVLMAMADFGQPILDLPKVAGSFDTDSLADRRYRVTIDTPAGLQAANFLLELLKYSPPDILSMSWYERIRPYAAGDVAMAYGYTLLAPYFELDEKSPACGNTGYLPHPAGPDADTVAPVGGYAVGIPANLPADRIPAAVQALQVFTSPEAQKLYVQNGSRTNPRYSVAADTDVRRVSPIFEAVDGMSWRDELQFWPRPPIPEIADIIQICGEEFHDMLRGIISPKQALSAAQSRAEELLDATRTP